MNLNLFHIPECISGLQKCKNELCDFFFTSYHTEVSDTSYDDDNVRIYAHPLGSISHGN